MDNKIKTHLETIKNSIERVEETFKKFKIDITSDDENEFHKYNTDQDIQDITERNLEKICEALTKIDKLDNNINISNKRKMIGLRIILSHIYNEIDNTVIWTIIKDHLGTLKLETEKLMKEMDEIGVE